MKFIPAPVEYVEEKIKAKVDGYNLLKETEKSGKYWDQPDDAALAAVKKHIKDYYIGVQDGKCPYCRQQMLVKHNGAWDAEHIIPKDLHPRFLFDPENLCVSCKDCNGEKSNKNVLKNSNYKPKKLPRNKDAYIICHPHFDTYEDEVKVVMNPLFHIPKSEKGRKTIESVLQNRAKPSAACG
jgi:5-methylcytosine-specific restriction endonuclease McrA